MGSQSSPIQGPQLWEIASQAQQQQQQRWRVDQQRQPQPSDQGWDRHVGQFEQPAPTNVETGASRVQKATVKHSIGERKQQPPTDASSAMNSNFRLGLFPNSLADHTRCDV